MSLNLSETEQKILKVLQESEECFIPEVAVRASLSVSEADNGISRLVLKGLLKNNELSPGVSTVEITEKGKEVEVTISWSPRNSLDFI